MVSTNLGEIRFFDGRPLRLGINKSEFYMSIQFIKDFSSSTGPKGLLQEYSSNQGLLQEKKSSRT